MFVLQDVGDGCSYLETVGGGGLWEVVTGFLPRPCRYELETESECVRLLFAVYGN